MRLCFKSSKRIHITVTLTPILNCAIPSLNLAMNFPCSVTGLRRYIILEHPWIHSLQNESLATRFLKWTQCQWIEDWMRNVLNYKIARRPTTHRLEHLYILYFESCNLWAYTNYRKYPFPKFLFVVFILENI